MDDKPSTLVDLSSHDGLGVILLLKTGIAYTNQSAGLACQHPNENGAYCPIPQEPGRAELFAISQHFQQGWKSISKQDVEFLNRIFRRFERPYRIDESRLKESFEAWVYVQLTNSNNDLFNTIATKAVLTWPNSD